MDGACEWFELAGGDAMGVKWEWFGLSGEATGDKWE